MPQILWVLLMLLAGMVDASRADAAAVSARENPAVQFAERKGDALANRVSDEQFVYCQSIVYFQTTERRWKATIQHPDGSRESINRSLRQLTYDDMPPKPWTNDALFEQYEILHMICFTEWVDVFNALDPFFLGKGSRLLQTSQPTEIEYRRVVLTLLFEAEEVALAEAIFPLKADLPKR